METAYGNEIVTSVLCETSLIVISPKNTFALIRLSNQRLDKPHLPGGLINVHKRMS